LSNRRNQLRKAVDADMPPMNPSVTENSLLKFATPTEIVELPSKGALYPQNHPLHNQETIEIKFMTAKEEDILTSQSLLRKGLAVERLLRSVIINKAIDPKSLLVGDRNAILYATRITGYGAEYPARVTCGNCGHNHDYEFDLENFKNGYKSFDPEKSEFEFSEDGTFFVMLPKSGIKLELRPMTGFDEDHLTKLQEIKVKKKLPESTLTDMFRTMIVSANGVTDKGQISEFIDNMPALDSKYLRAAYQNAVPNVELSEAVECPQCGEITETEVPFTVAFFWPDQ
jgi:hypothetical protein